MTTKKAPAKKVTIPKVVISRVIKAPCPLVFKAWTDADQIVQWFSPEDTKCKSVVADVKAGGAFRIHMVSKKGDHIAVGKYKKVVSDKRLQFTWQWEAYAMPDSVVTVDFEDLGKTTRLTFTHEGFPDKEDASDHNKGWTSALKKFARLMEHGKIKSGSPEMKTAGKKAVKDYAGQKFIFVREFDAPRELVFKAWTDAKHVAQWWGPHGFTNPICEWDPRAGKAIHVVMRAPDGAEHPMGGKFREVVAPKRLVFTANVPDGKGGVLFEFLHTITFAEKNGKTILTVHSSVTKTTAEANKYIGGFEAGMTQSLERLAEFVVASPRPLVIERTFNAPVAKVWNALTNKEEITQWSFDMKEFKPEVGFEFEFYGEKDGVKYFHRCVITEAIPRKKLAYTWRYEGHQGNSLVTFELFAEGKQTRLRLTHEGLESFPKTPAFARENFVKGWTMIVGSLLKEYVENKFADREIVITRIVDAPRELVWEAMTNPRHVINWWGPSGFSDTIEKMDVRPGGVWQHVMHGPDGTDYPNKSVFKEVVKPERLVFSHGGGKKGGPGVSFVATWTFDCVLTAKTKVTIRMVFPSAAKRDFVVKEFGAIEGGKQTLNRLSEYLLKMA
jgi:uncharacterized protein YndB with AHSA1/START domain